MQTKAEKRPYLAGSLLKHKHIAWSDLMPMLIVFEAITQLIEENEKPKKKIGYLKEGLDHV